MENEARIVRLAEMAVGQQADCFALLAAKDRATTRDGKPYYRVLFRDADRTVTAMIWSDSAWFVDCETRWQVGEFYKLRCLLTESQYGPQIELDRIRAVGETDRADGFDPTEFFQSTRFDVDQMFDELRQIASEQISDDGLRQLVVGLLEEHAADIKQIAAAARYHHAFTGGYLEHTLSVTRTAVYLADKYIEYYPNMAPPLSKSLVVAGAILHDIGKLQELQYQPQGSTYTAVGRLIGHILLGRDMIREKAEATSDMDAEMLLRLEHIVVSHQNLPEWGSPVAPHTPEALLVYFADDVDAKFHEMVMALNEGTADEFTSRNNPLRRSIFRGLQRPDSER